MINTAHIAASQGSILNASHRNNETIYVVVNVIYYANKTSDSWLLHKCLGFVTQSPWLCSRTRNSSLLNVPSVLLTLIRLVTDHQTDHRLSDVSVIIEMCCN